MMSIIMNVPQLRFSDFSGGWKHEKLRDIANIKSGLTPLRSNKTFFDNGNIIWVKTTDLNNSIISKTEECITPLALEKTSIKLYPKDTVLVAMYGGFNQIGRTGILKYEATTNQALSALLTKDLIVLPKYLLIWLNAKVKVWRKFASSSRKDPNITGSDVASFPISYPSYVEQEKIASFLTLFDTKIEQLTFKAKLLQEYKKGVMQKIFLQEIRFKADDGSEYPAWVEKELGELCKITTGKSNREDSGLDGKYTFFDRSEDIRTSNIYLFDAEAIIVAGEGSNFPPKYFKGKFDLHQRTYAIMKFEKVYAKYLYYFMDKNKNYLLKYAVGSTVKSLRLPIFQKMTINFPSLAEQVKIANFLSSIDSKIEQAQKQLNSTKEFKKALLQQMFV